MELRHARDVRFRGSESGNVMNAPGSARLGVSFVVVTLNDRVGLAQTLESIAEIRNKCSALRCECIVVDGLSNPPVTDVIEQFRQVVERFISEADAGIYEAMEKGVALASLSHICFLNSGDIGVADGFAKIRVDGLRHDRSYYGRAEWAGGDPGFKALAFAPVLLRMPIHQAMLISRTWATVNKFDRRFSVGADLDQKLSLHRQGLLEGIPHTLCTSRVGGMSQRIRSVRHLLRRAHEQGRIAHKHYGTLGYLLNAPLFAIWHARKLVARRFGKW